MSLLSLFCSELVYARSLRNLNDARQHREYPNHSLIVSEYRAGSDCRLHSFHPQPFDYSIEYQQKYLESYLPVIEDSVFIAGASHWNLIDFSSANRTESMPHINNKGILTNSRDKKDIFYYFSAMWHNLDSDTIAHIAVDDWQQRRFGFSFVYLYEYQYKWKYCRESVFPWRRIGCEDYCETSL